MKKLLMLVAMAATTVAFAQENTATDTLQVHENTGVTWYIGFGAIVNPDFNINSNLKDAGVHRIADVMPGVIFGWETTVKRISIDAEFGAAGMYNDFKDDGYQLLQASFGLKVQYALIHKQNTSLFGGLSASYILNDLSVFNTDTTIDINNLNPDNNSGYLRINNQSFFLGPVVSVRLFKQKQYPLTIKAGYDINLSNSRWKSDYANVANVVKENGNRFYVNFSVPLNKLFGR